MKMKICLVLSLICAVLHAQSNISSIIVQYDSKLGANHMYSTLIGNNDKSIFFYSNATENVNINVFEDKKIDINPYYLFIYDLGNDLFYKSLSYESLSIFKKNGMSIDHYPKMIWKITNENKDILGIKCIKATTSFRGRNWTVWFTTDISSSYFPWKFEGLPGLILSFTDDSGNFSANAISIVQNKEVSAIFRERIDTFFNNYKDAAIDYRVDTENENKWLQEKRNERRAAAPLGVEISETDIREMAFEKTFEWNDKKGHK